MHIVPETITIIIGRLHYTSIMHCQLINTYCPDIYFFQVSELLQFNDNTLFHG